MMNPRCLLKVIKFLFLRDFLKTNFSCLSKLTDDASESVSRDHNGINFQSQPEEIGTGSQLDQRESFEGSSAGSKDEFAAGKPSATAEPISPLPAAVERPSDVTTGNESVPNQFDRRVDPDSPIKETAGVRQEGEGDTFE